MTDDNCTVYFSAIENHIKQLRTEYARFTGRSVLVVKLIPLEMGKPAYGPFRVTAFSYSGDHDDNAQGVLLPGASGYRLDAVDDRGNAFQLWTGSANGYYSLQCIQER